MLAFAGNSASLYRISTSTRIEFVKGPTWTHEALYRETACEVELCQKEGILTVDMEAAALFAVAAYHNVEIASLFTISDSLADYIWNPQSLHKDVSRNLGV